MDYSLIAGIATFHLDFVFTVFGIPYKKDVEYGRERYVTVESFVLDGCHSSHHAGNLAAETTTLGLKQIGLRLFRTDPAFQT